MEEENEGGREGRRKKLKGRGEKGKKRDYREGIGKE